MVNINKYNQEQLNKYQFTQTIKGKVALYTTFEWSNHIFKIRLSFDRGYFDCLLYPANRKSLQTDALLFSILSFLKKKEFEYRDINPAETNLFFDLIFANYNELVYYFNNYEKCVIQKKEFEKI